VTTAWAANLHIVRPRRRSSDEVGRRSTASSCQRWNGSSSELTTPTRSHVKTSHAEFSLPRPEYRSVATRSIVYLIPPQLENISKKSSFFIVLKNLNCLRSGVDPLTIMRENRNAACVIGHSLIHVNKKFELMLTRRAIAYSSSGSVA